MHSSGLSFEASVNGEIQGKCVEGLAAGTRLTGALGTSGRGLAYCSKTFVGRAGMRTQWSHNAVKWEVSFVLLVS
jgi:hypothetical protein